MWWGLGGEEQPSHCLEQIDAFEDRRIASSEKNEKNLANGNKQTQYIKKFKQTN